MAGDAYPAGAARDSVVARLRGIAEYVRLFAEAFPAEAAALPGPAVVTMDTYGRAVAAYERELVTRHSPFDRYANGDDGALTERQKRGLEVFFAKSGCVLPGDDTGREEHTANVVDRYAFRTPTLRNVELTAPYMHDGALATLEEVVRFYDRGAQPRHPAVSDALVDSLVRTPLELTEEEIEALVDFMRALTDPGTALDPVLLTVPDSVPSGLTPVFGVRAP